MLEYAYLVSCIFFSLLVLVLCIATREHWKLYVVSAFACLPYGFTSFLFVPEYWDPPMVLRIYLPGEFFLASVEDILFTAATAAALMWVLVKVGGPTEVTRSFSFGALNLIGLAGLQIAVWLAAIHFWLGPEGVMPGLVCGNAAMLIPLLLFNRRHVGRSLLATLLFTLVYTGAVILVKLLWPEFIETWNYSATLQTRLLGIPVMESVWAVAFAFGWSMLMIQVMGLRQVKHD